MGPASDYPRTDAPTLTSLSVDNSELSRRKELADFLRTRREALTPEQAGLSKAKRRRAKGLRREEVAEAAGISVAWYTWMEQSRDLKISETTLESLSHALHLEPQERHHLFELAGHPAPLPRTGSRPANLMASVQAVIDSMDPNPSYVLDSHWNLLAWNRAATLLFGDFDLLPPANRNFVRLTFTQPSFRTLFADWEEVAHCTLAHFRSDSAAQVGDARWLALIDDLSAESEEFRQWWPRHDVNWPHSWQKEILHPELGRLFYNTFDLELSRPAKLRIVTYTPLIPNSPSL